MVLVFLAILVVLSITITQAALPTDKGPVTCGSVVKLIHVESGKNLHSHQIAWGSGSGQQSVTATGTSSDKGSMWILKEGQKLDSCTTGTPIKCNDVIRFQHMDTGKNLHSHAFRAPLSGQQEVSGFGEDGKGDTGDDWTVICDSDKTFWGRYESVQLQHTDTKKYLMTHSQFMFDARNCGHQCPIMDQLEVSSTGRGSMSTRWRTDQGVFFPSPDMQRVDDEDDDEL